MICTSILIHLYVTEQNYKIYATIQKYIGVKMKFAFNCSNKQEKIN